MNASARRSDPAHPQPILEAEPIEVNGVWRVRVRFANGEISLFERPVEREIIDYEAAGDQRSAWLLGQAAIEAARSNGLR